MTKNKQTKSIKDFELSLENIENLDLEDPKNKVVLAWIRDLKIESAKVANNKTPKIY